MNFVEQVEEQMTNLNAEKENDVYKINGYTIRATETSLTIINGNVQPTIHNCFASFNINELVEELNKFVQRMSQ